jgi:chromosomal replication initiator protein
LAGQENALVRMLAAAAIASDLEYNPVVLCGASGVGKTVVAQAIAARRREALSLATVINTTGSDFARSLAHAIDTESVAELRSRYQRCDLLLIDEVHRLVGKPAAQQLLVATIDALVRRGSLVVATLCQLPQATRGLSPTLASRLASGLVVPLVAPGLLARRQLVRNHASSFNLALSDEAIDQLAGGDRATPMLLTAPRLRHAVMQLAAATEKNPKALRPTQIARLLDGESPETKVVLRHVTAAVARHSQITVRDLKGKSRQQTIADARGLAMYLARRLTKASYAEIGSHFGNRDHSTVLHACRKFDRLVARDDAARRLVGELSTQIAAGETAG